MAARMQRLIRQVEAVPEILDSLVVGQDWENDVRVVLFVKLRDGHKLDEELIKRIKDNIRRNASPRHVPARIIAVEDIPYRLSGKKDELAVQNVIHGKEVKNRLVLANPQALEFYKDLRELAV